ncbi:MAG: UDP-N-acetylglucosamine 2-epimerase (non-hydrolyzing) [Candidatus Cloacimonetes bacterium]|jgi:UDP-N-acetylglucosamine 2-epimerase (non-hydrolysing)|nr:UDP-N-acetylglucosamine 2-epimerase (non-hydrolyzing) [Candidatus Cloacimonadota bacterium]MBT6993897.1 UDP-N-acetylglucosamine 2-epimerase (non-hydrolyzing) [Candidatus Cloacimonadota bacterium]MBT7470344.1 UDP-N-acetylglucosamine 2-epimerase (non-hydrolyzing) [Candidatus Cloacimonadota bacterium]
MKIISVVGARPNFMKIAPFIKAIKKYDKNIQHILVHTGQHYDVKMSQSFFEALDISKPGINLEIGSGSHAEQVGKTMIAFEKVLLSEKPDWVVVVGDVNATLACSVTAKKHHVKVCHIEAGLRSGDLKMPEEINRLVTDRLSDLLLTPDLMSNENLIREGVSEDKIKFVGNIMIDTLEANREKAQKLKIGEIIENNKISENSVKLTVNDFALMTLHRPSNVDKKEILAAIVDFILNEVVRKTPLIWSIHPRTKKQLQKFKLWEKITSCEDLILLNPIGYHEMLKLNMKAKIMLTDSGGLQEECTVLGTPCLTLRWNTERPITLQKFGGASVLVGNNIERIRKEYNAILDSKIVPLCPKLWDGKTAERCVDAIVNYNS